jgi:hypothetical protein
MEDAMKAELARELEKLRTWMRWIDLSRSKGEKHRSIAQTEAIEGSIGRLTSIKGGENLAKAATLFFDDQRRLDIAPAELAALYSTAAATFGQQARR